MKKESNLKRLLDYAGGYKYLTIASWILSAISALVALLPFVYIWKVIREILDVSPDTILIPDLASLKKDVFAAIGAVCGSCDFDLCCGTDLFTSGGFPCTGKYSYESNAPHRDTAYGVHGQYGQRQGQKDCL